MNKIQSEFELYKKIQVRPKKPYYWAVYFINDDITPMDFVIGLLEVIFHHTTHNATKLMMQVHEEGSAQVGTYPWEIAETKSQQAKKIARLNQYPLKVIIKSLEKEI